MRRGREAIHAWKGSTEFKERIGRVKQHTEDFTAAELELETRVESVAHVLPRD